MLTSAIIPHVWLQGFSSKIAVDFLVCTDHVEMDIGNILNIIFNAAMLKKDPGNELAMNIGFVWFIVSSVGSYTCFAFILFNDNDVYCYVWLCCGL